MNTPDIRPPKLITFYEAKLGPMWSGKTTASDYKIRVRGALGLNSYILDTCNTRNTERDLRNKVVGADHVTILSSIEDLYNIYDANGLVVIDEVHLYEVFGLAKQLEKAVAHLNGRVRNVIVCGLLIDCYNDFRIFPVWSRLLPLMHEVCMYQSFKPCDECGATEQVIYTLPTGTEKIGDSYKNICYKCYHKEDKRG